MRRKLLFLAQFLVIGCLFTATGYSAPYNFQFGLQTFGGVNFGGPLGVYPAGFGPASCSAVSGTHTHCTGGNFVGAGTFVGVVLDPGGIVSDVTTWNALMVMTPNNAHLYGNDPSNNFVQILTNAGWFFPGIQPSQYATYLGAANIFTQGTPPPVINLFGASGYSYQIFTKPTGVPEPSTLLLLMSSGVLALAGRRRLAKSW